MTLLSWRSDYRVGINVIDSEHQALFDLINDFHDKYAGGDTHGQLLGVLNRLVAYAEAHFQHEETLMREIGYPHLAEHQQMHEQLYSSIFALNEKLSQHGATMNADTLRFLKTWITGHILQEDLSIGELLERKLITVGKGAPGAPLATRETQPSAQVITTPVAEAVK